MALTLRRHRAATVTVPIRSMFRVENDHDIRHFRAMWSKTRVIGVAPARELHNFSGLDTRGRPLGWFNDVKSIAIQKESVISEQIVELWNGGMRVRNGLRIELADSPFHQIVCQFHCAFLSIGPCPSIGFRNASVAPRSNAIACPAHGVIDRTIKDFFSSFSADAKVDVPAMQMSACVRQDAALFDQARFLHANRPPPAMAGKRRFTSLENASNVPNEDKPIRLCDETAGNHVLHPPRHHLDIDREFADMAAAFGEVPAGAFSKGHDPEPVEAFFADRRDGLRPARLGGEVEGIANLPRQDVLEGRSHLRLARLATGGGRRGDAQRGKDARQQQTGNKTDRAHHHPRRPA